MATQKSTVRSFFVSQENIIKPVLSQPLAASEKDTQDPLIARQVQIEVYILAAILLVTIIFVIGLINRKVEEALLFALFLSGILIALFFSLFN